jgi:hypothetical protein
MGETENLVLTMADDTCHERSGSPRHGERTLGKIELARLREAIDGALLSPVPGIALAALQLGFSEPEIARLQCAPIDSEYTFADFGNHRQPLTALVCECPRMPIGYSWRTLTRAESVMICTRFNY